MKANVFYLVALVAALVITFPSNLLAEDSPQKPNKVEAKDDRVNVDVEDADISDVLSKIEKETGVKTTIGQGLTGKKISARFENLNIEDSLREILKNNYYVLTYVQDTKRPEKKVLEEIKADGDIIGKIPLPGKLITWDIPYGSGEGEIAVHDGGEGDSSGPSCYAVNDQGDIYIPAAINKKILKYTARGVQLPSIPAERAGCDIVVDNKGFIYIYSPGDKILYQFNVKGIMIGKLDVETGNEIAGIKYIGNNIFLYSCTKGPKCGEYLIAKIKANNELIKPTAAETMEVKDEYSFQSGRKYMGKKHVQGYNDELYIESKDGTVYRTVSTPSDNILSSELFGEDLYSNFYFQTRTAENEDRLYNIDKYSPNGDYIGTAKIPGGKNYYGAFKSFQVSGNGNIYGFFPGPWKLTIYVFLSPGN
ncbi:MAG: hypothetical protein M0Z67_14120, partial [Nitrospiraceae bacterium]|nr:hypothetical protein [Nitrospiraceae bacterium]